MIQKEEIEEIARWAAKKLARIERYEAAGTMPETVATKLPLQCMKAAAENILANPDDPQKELWERAIDLAHQYI